jgi:hypothetical protein
LLTEGHDGPAKGHPLGANPLSATISGTCRGRGGSTIRTSCHALGWSIAGTRCSMAALLVERLKIAARGRRRRHEGPRWPPG